MRHRVHRRPTHGRTNTPPAVATGFADLDILVIRIADLPDGGLAIYQYHANLTRRQFNQSIAIFLCHQLGIGPGTSYNLSALSRSQFKVMNLRSQRDIAERQCIARLNVGIGT